MTSESNQHSSLPGLRYAGTRNYVYDNGRSERLHVLAIDTENGQWDVIRCKTEAQARELAGLFEQYEDLAIRADERLKMIDEYGADLARMSEEKRGLQEQLEAAQNAVKAADLYIEAMDKFEPGNLTRREVDEPSDGRDLHGGRLP